MPLPDQQYKASSEQPLRRKSSRGFTLVELLMVLAIIGALAAISIPIYNSYVNKAKITVAVSTMDTIRKTMEIFELDHQQYPTEPIDFSTGRDSALEIVFEPTLRDQINNDLIDPTYNTATGSYVFTAKAKNAEQTLITLTPSATTY